MILADSYLPGHNGGGPVISISNFVERMKFDFEILVCTSAYDFGEIKPYKDIAIGQIIEHHGYKIIYHKKLNFFSLAKTIREFNPASIYLNSFFSSNVQRVILLNKFFFTKRLILATRGELQTNALSIKQNKKNIFIFLSRIIGLHKNIFFQATDQIEVKAIKSKLEIESSYIAEIPNIAKLYEFGPLKKNSNELKLVFVSRICKKKNLNFAIQSLKGLKGSVILDIFGPIEDIKYWGLCQNSIKGLPENITVSYKGSLDNPSVIDVMRKYHSLLLPTLSENYGHVIVEAMQVGLVPIISNKTPWNNLERNMAGWNISVDNLSEYTLAISTLYSMDSEKFFLMSQNSINYIHNRIKKISLIDRYKEIFSE